MFLPLSNLPPRYQISLPMFANRPRPIIGKLSALLLSGNHAAGFSDVGSSPRGPLDFKSQSPRSLKCYELGGVGLGIVAALEKCSSSSGSNSSSSSSTCSVGGHEILAKFAVCSPSNFTKSSPKPVSSGRTCDRSSGEDGIIKQSPPRVVVEEIPIYPTSCFMSSCNLCRKKLHGKDIYMYRGEKAFCSSECRSRQIMMDENKEVSTSSSPCTGDLIFSTGIFAI